MAVQQWLHARRLVPGRLIVMDGDHPRLRSDGRADIRFAFFDRDRAEIIDTWHRHQ